jgi:PAS domain S-box-containing protein
MKSNILIIRTEEAVDRYLQDRLTGPDQEVIAVTDSLEEALPLIAVQSPDLIISDILSEPGFGTIEAVKEMAAKYNCALVCLFAAVDEQLLEQLKQIEPFTYLKKPFNEKELRFAIELAQHKRVQNNELVAAKKALVESEKQSRDLLENLPIGIYQTTPQGKILYANPMLVKMLGYGSFAEMTARDLSAEEFEPSYSRQEFCERLERENQIIGLEALWKRQDGTSMFVRENVRVLRDSQGAVLYYEGTVEDISESKAFQTSLHHSNERFKRLFNNAPYSMVISTLDEGRILDVNDTCLQRSELTRDEVLGRSLKDIEMWIDGDGRKKIARMLRETGYIRNLEIPYLMKNGQERIGLYSADLMEFGNEVCVIGAMQDITERKETENVLRELTARFQAVFNLAPHPMLISRLSDGKLINVNDTFTQVFGYEKDEVIGRTSKECGLYVNVEDRTKIYRLLQETGSAHNLEILYRLKNGDVRIGLNSSEVVEVDHQKIAIAAITDITERKQAEDALSASEERYRLIAEHSTDLIARHAPDGRYLYASPASRTLLGYEPEEMVDRTAYDFVHPEDRQPLKELQATIFKTQDIYTQAFRFICKDGSSKWVESTVKNIRDPQTRRIVEILSVSRDITKRKQAEEALRASEDRFRKLAVNSPNYIHLIDLTKKRVVYSNRQYIFGYETSELNNYGFLKSLIYFDDKEPVRDHWLNFLQGNSGGLEFRIRKKDGTWEWLDCRYNALYFDAQGKPLQSLLTVNVITERKLAEELLQKYANELNDLYQYAPCGYYSIDSEGTIVRMNDTELKWLGYSRDEVIGRMKYWDVVRIGDIDYGKQQFTLLKDRGWIKDLEGELVRKDGSTMPILLNATAVKDENGNFLHSRSTIYDMTERHRTEEIIHNTNERLQALSAHLLSVREEERTRIAREIHDEFGPTLTILKFDLFALGKKLTNEQHELLQKIWSMSSQIDGAVGSVRKICSDLRPAILDFGLSAAIEWLTADFEKITGVACKVHLKTDSITFTDEVSTTLFRIIQEGLTNVARHAEATTVYVMLEKVQDRVELSISDNGRGISPENISSLRSFGLLGIRERTRLLGGEVNITGKAGSGTHLQLFIPLAQTGEQAVNDSGKLRLDVLDLEAPQGGISRHN